jgi:hypothetical protein
MSTALAKIFAATCFATIALTALARADCEDDMDKLDKAMKDATLTPEASKALKDAKKVAVEAVKKDDDTTCNKVITDAMKKAGHSM